MLTIIKIVFMVTNAQKAKYRGGKTNKINKNVVRVSYKKISACSIRRLNL